MAIPKILAPAGDLLSAKSAIYAGADEVYLGLNRFNARRSAKEITVDDLLFITKLAHQHGASVFLTLNVLLTQSEINSAIQLLSEAIERGIDGVIVQNLSMQNVL